MRYFMRKDCMFLMEWRKKMLNIFADALLIATRFAHVAGDENRNRPPRPMPHEFRENEGLRIADHIRNSGR
jgi:hypothetical protein